jgi:hypothetical protein
MKKPSYFLFSLFLLLAACNKEKDPVVEPQKVESFNVRFYKPDINTDPNIPQLQMSLTNDSKQFSTLGFFNSSGQPLSPKYAYIFDSNLNKQAVILFDEQMEPAFIYGVDLNLKKKDNSLIEILPLNASTNIIRLYYYNWDSRLGTLLLETKATQNGGNLTFQKIFEISDPNFNGRKSGNSKQNHSFPIPLERFENLQSRGLKDFVEINNGQALRVTSNDDVLSYLEPFIEMTQEVKEFVDGISDVALNVAEGGVAVGVIAALGGVTTGPAIIAAGVSIAAATKVTSWALNGALSIYDEVKNGPGIPFVSGNEISLEIEINNIPININVGTFEGYNFISNLHLNGKLGELVNSASKNLNEVISYIQNLLIKADDLNDLPDSNGVLQFGLIWDTGNTDIDLHVTDPSGNTINWQNPNSPTGGYLDRDDTDGNGPENIYFQKNIPDGLYLVNINYYGPEDGPSTNCHVSVINGLGFNHAVDMNLSMVGSSAFAFKVQKTGNSITVR